MKNEFLNEISYLYKDAFLGDIQNGRQSDAMLLNPEHLLIVQRLTNVFQFVSVVIVALVIIMIYAQKDVSTVMIGWMLMVSLAAHLTSKILFMFGGSHVGAAYAKDWAEFKDAMQYLGLLRHIKSAPELNLDAEQVLINAFSSNGFLYKKHCSIQRQSYESHFVRSVQLAFTKLIHIGFEFPEDTHHFLYKHWGVLKPEK